SGGGARPGAGPVPPGSPLPAAGTAMSNTMEEARGAAGPVSVETRAPVVGRRTVAPPRAVDDFAVVPSDRATRIDVLANDADPDGLDPRSLAVVSGPDHGDVTVDRVRGAVVYESDPGYVGADAFRYRVCDKKDSCSVVTVRVTVVPR
ncbi:MAG: Ig-like domain-containing protein, partial [Actinomycetota bacterium]|nr:Ig-like domain-containing protein [Actinomycetota bacterium]